PARAVAGPLPRARRTVPSRRHRRVLPVAALVPADAGSVPGGGPKERTRAAALCLPRCPTLACRVK
ncbi:hypothetical protein ACFPZ4_05605, partial [Micromonospora harpali]